MRRYKSQSLIKRDNYQFILIKNSDVSKFSDRNQKYIDKKLHELSDNMRDAIVNTPINMSEESDYQSYMLFLKWSLEHDDKYDIYGGVIISPSVDEKNLEVEFEFCNENFDIKKIVFEVVNSLKEYYYQYQNIEIKLTNCDIDLPFGEKKIYDQNLTTYTVSNKRNYEKYLKIYNEMNETEKNLTAWNLSWRQSIEKIHSDDFDYYFDNPKEFDYDTVPSDEIFTKADVINWHGIESKKSTRNIEFNKNGDVYFDKFGNSRSYTFKYNLFKEGFTLERRFALEIGKEEMVVDNNSEIYFKTNIIDNVSIDVYLHYDEDKIDKCYIDFNYHKNSRRNWAKTKGKYMLRISRYFNENRITLNYVSRKGFKDWNIINRVFAINPNLYAKIVSGEFDIKELISSVVQVINLIESNNKTNPLINNQVVEAANSKGLSFLKEIKGEIPLPTLSERVNNFVDSLNLNKENSLKRKKYRG